MKPEPKQVPPDLKGSNSTSLSNWPPKRGIVGRFFEPSQPLRIISGLNRKEVQFWSSLCTALKPESVIMKEVLSGDATSSKRSSLFNWLSVKEIYVSARSARACD